MYTIPFTHVGHSQCVMVNSLTKTPAFEQDVQHTDFLVVISTETISGEVTAKVSVA